MVSIPIDFGMVGTSNFGKPFIYYYKVVGNYEIVYTMDKEHQALNEPQQKLKANTFKDVNAEVICYTNDMELIKPHELRTSFRRGLDTPDLIVWTEIKSNKSLMISISSERL